MLYLSRTMVLLRAFFMILLLTLTLTPTYLNAQVLSGPMLGNNTMREVTVWLQTEKEAEVQMEYWTDGTNEKRRTAALQTLPFHGNTVHLVAQDLEPGTTYNYKIFIDGKQFESDSSLQFTTQELWQYRKDPPPFSFALGSCLYTNDPPYDRPGSPYGDTSEAIFGSILAKKADFMLWLGDNVYLRTPDFDSRTGVYYRYTDYKSRDSLQKLWRSMHHYAIWDDHDFGPNNSDRSYIYKDLTRQAFKDFWANPTYGRDGKGIYTEFRWSDCQFLLLDNRFFRTPNELDEKGRTVLGKEQLQWLKDRLFNSNAAFKFVAMGGQFLNPSALYENYANYEEERQEIIDFIHKHQIKNVIFLTGDRHRSELSVLELKNTPLIYDLTVSPLSSGTYGERPPEENTYRVDGTMVAQRNFGLVEVEGPYGERRLLIRVFNKQGKQLWEYAIEAEQE